MYERVSWQRMRRSSSSLKQMRVCAVWPLRGAAMLALHTKENSADEEQQHKRDKQQWSIVVQRRIRGGGREQKLRKKTQLTRAPARICDISCSKVAGMS